MGRRSGHPERGQRVVFLWEEFAHAQALGKQVNVPFLPPFFGGPVFQQQFIPSVNVETEDGHAQPVQLVLCPPEISAGIPANPETVNTGFDNVGAVGQDLSFANPVAVVEWGVGGTSAKAQCDFINGLVLNLTCAFLRVTASVENPQVTTNTAVYLCRAFVGPGYPKPNNAQKTVLLPPIAINTESNVFPVPRFAKLVKLVGANNAHDAFTSTIRFWRSAGGSADGFRVADMLFADTIPAQQVPNGAYYFSIVSGIAAPNSIMAIFDLAI